MVDVTLKVVSVKNWWRSCDHFTCIHSKSKVEECKGFDGDYVIILYTSTQSKVKEYEALVETMGSFCIPPLKVKSGGVWRTDWDHVIIINASTQSQKWRIVKETMGSFYIPSLKSKVECKGLMESMWYSYFNLYTYILPMCHWLCLKLWFISC